MENSITIKCYIILSVLVVSGFSNLDRREGDMNNLETSRRNCKGLKIISRLPQVSMSTFPISPYCWHLFSFSIAFIFGPTLNLFISFSLLCLNLGQMPSSHDPSNSSGPGTNRKPDPDGLDMYEGGKVDIVVKHSGANSRKKRPSFPCCHTVQISEESIEELEEGKLIGLFKGCDGRSVRQSRCLPNRHRVCKWGSSAVQFSLSQLQIPDVITQDRSSISLFSVQTEIMNRQKTEEMETEGAEEGKQMKCVITCQAETLGEEVAGKNDIMWRWQMKIW